MMMFFVERVRNKSTEKNPGSAKASIGNAAYVACLPLLCQGSEWLNSKSV